jgi:hypothetical protein
MRAISSAKSSTYTTQTSVDRGPIYSREVSCVIDLVAVFSFRAQLCNVNNIKG